MFSFAAELVCLISVSSGSFKPRASAVRLHPSALNGARWKNLHQSSTVTSWTSPNLFSQCPVSKITHISLWSDLGAFLSTLVYLNFADIYVYISLCYVVLCLSVVEPTQTNGSKKWAETALREIVNHHARQSQLNLQAKNDDVYITPVRLNLRSSSLFIEGNSKHEPESRLSTGCPWDVATTGLGCRMDGPVWPSRSEKCFAEIN